MPIIVLIFWLAVIGLATYLVLRFVPMNDAMKQFLPWVVIVICIIWVLTIIGLLPIGGGPLVPRVR
jgi:hypothetical protein